MANQEHLAILRRGVRAWNEWRESSHEQVDLTEANLSEADLSDVNLSDASLRNADLSGANLVEATLAGADLWKANLSRADLPEAYLFRANLRKANLSVANLWRANLQQANLSAANLSAANLSNANLAGANLSGGYLFGALLVETNFTGANLDGAYVYGVSVWGITLEGAQQSGLVITSEREPDVIVDDIEVAQFIYLILHNKNIRTVIDTITSKVVLILGRFTPERKPVLEALRTALRTHGYSPVLFDFEKPASRDLTEAIATLAGMARFVIADITDARSIPQELMAIVPAYPSVPVQPVLLSSQQEYGMFEHFRRYPWVLPVVLYETQDELLRDLYAKVIAPAEERARSEQGSKRESA